MIRRHASTLRALLMLTDGALAAVVLVGLSWLRFGDDWAIWWRQIIPNAEALLLFYAVGWVVALALNGMYRPRARWSIRSEAWDLLRATVLMAVATFAVLFWFKLPDVSRLFLVLLFPTQYVVTLVTQGGPAAGIPAAPIAWSQCPLRAGRRCRAPRAVLRDHHGGPR